MNFLFDKQSITVNVPNWHMLKAKISNRFLEREGFALATINLDHLVKLGHDKAFLTSYQAQDFIVADGCPITWLSYLANQPVDLMPGSDMVTPLAELAASAKAKVALVGSSEAVLQKAGAELSRRVPGLEVAYVRAPSRGFDPFGAEARGILQDLDAQDIGLCFIALGAPKQEHFARLGRELAPRTGFASIGAGLDFIAGAQRRAPRLVRKLALEWLWRMLSNPLRLMPRYIKCILILPGQVVHALRLRMDAGAVRRES